VCVDEMCYFSATTRQLHVGLTRTPSPGIWSPNSSRSAPRSLRTFCVDIDQRPSHQFPTPCFQCSPGVLGLTLSRHLITHRSRRPHTSTGNPLRFQFGWSETQHIKNPPRAYLEPVFTSSTRQTCIPKMFSSDVN